MVDVLARTGQFEEAERYVELMSTVNVITWKTLLGACRSQGNIEKADYYAKKAIALDPNDASIYVLLVNIYAKAGLYEKEAEVRLEMKKRGIKKIPWNELDSH